MRGFTMIELIMVLVMLGVLAVFAAPRLTITQDVQANGFHDATLAYLRYAQKMAVAQRRTVCVTWSSGGAGLTLAMASAAGATTCAPSVALIGPKFETPAALVAPAGVTYGTPQPTNFNFDALGQPLSAAGAVLAANQTLKVANQNKVITIEARTGYVHE